MTIMLRSKMKKLFLPLLFVFAAAAASSAELPRGEWRCVALTPRVLALTGDYSDLRLRLFKERIAARRRGKLRLPKWKKELFFDLAATEAIAMYRPRVAEMFRDSPRIGVASARGAVTVRRTGYWMNPIGQARFPYEDGRERLSRNADVAHYLFLVLDRELADGEKIDIALPAGEKVEFTYRRSDPTPIIRVNQLGYMPKAPKFAYLGAWLGTGGALPLHKEFAGTKFQLVDAATGKAVFTGELRARFADPADKTGTPFTGEEVLELDFSSVDKPGRYYLVAEKLGRSFEFRIGDDTMAEAFYIHARGLFHQRCGIARGEPHTHWQMPACHMQCVRGDFPPDDAHYGKGDARRPYGFRDADGRSIRVDHFKLIRQNPPPAPEVLTAPGGWHDAADWDRRPQHLVIVGDLAAVYLLKPGNFSDGQLDLPESGNGIPDILDEARWGIEHLRLKQQPDGGVGTWTEAQRHPNPNDGCCADDKLVYYVSCATRNSTLQYAAYAAELALALKQAGAEKEAALYCESARRAWEFALNPDNRVKRAYHYEGKTIFYSEEPELAPEYLVKAGFDLFQLTDDRRFLEAAEAAAKEATGRLRSDGWRWSPFFLIELEIFPFSSSALSRFRKALRKSLILQARKMLRDQEENYPIRVPWLAPDAGSLSKSGCLFW